MNKTRSNELSEKSGGLMEGIKSYLKGVRSEWDKITWPEKDQIVRETMVVLFVVIAFTIVVLLMDLVFKFVFHGLTGISGR